MSAALFSRIVFAISAAGYGGVCGLMTLESACIPLPSEIIMPFAGYLVSVGRFNLLLVATVGALGCNIGSTAAYLVGAHGGRAAVRKWGRYVLFPPDELERLDGLFARFGGAAVLIGRVLPVVRTFISLPAGIARMPLIRFEVYTFIGSWPWCFVLAYIGLKLGQQWNTNPQLKSFFSRFDWAIGIALVGAFALYIFQRWRRFGS